MTSANVRIVPRMLGDGTQSMSTQGTAVFVGDVEMRGVLSIAIYLETNDVWRAKIECTVVPLEMHALADIQHYSYWATWKSWFKNVVLTRKAKP